MKRLAWRPGSGQVRRSLLAAAAVTSVGLVLWGRAQPHEPAAGEGVRPIPPPGGATGAATRVEPRARIEFPRRTSATASEPGLFAEHSWYVPPPPPPPPKPAPPVAPSAPPLPFNVLGSYSLAGGGQVYYLVKGEQVYDVKIGDTLDGVYSVDAVQGDDLVLTYLPLKQQQSLALGR